MIQLLRDAVAQHQHFDYAFSCGRELTFDVLTCQMILQVHDAVKPATRCKIVRHLTANYTSCVRTVDKLWSMVK